MLETKSHRTKSLSLAALLAVLLIAAACTSEQTATDEATEVPTAASTATPSEDDAPSEPTAPPATEPPIEDAPLEASDVGVSPTSIKIAYIGFDTTVLVALGIVEDTADTPVVAQAIVDDINDRGGIHGRTIELVPEIWNPLETDLNAELQRACLAVTEDAEVFAATALSFFGDAVTCLVTDHNTPLLTQGTLPGSLIESGNRNTFSLNLEEGRAVASSAKLLAGQGHFDDLERLGAFGDDAPGRLELIEETLATALDNSDRTLDSVGLVPPNLAGSGAETAAVVTRFKEDGVDGVFLLGNLLSNGAFMVEADKQGYNPRYLMSDFGDGTSDLLVTRAPASQLEGALGTTWRRTGQSAAGEDASEYDLSCFDRFGGDVVLDDVRQEAVLGAVAEQCVTFDVLERALVDAGPNPTRESYVAAMEGIGSFDMGIPATGSFSSAKHDAIDSLKTVQWQSDCECWFPITEYQPIE